MFWIGQLLALVAGLISISLIRKHVRRSWPWVRESYLDAASVMVLVLGLAIAASIYATDSREQQRLRKKLGTVQGQLSDLESFGAVAKWGFTGSKLLGGGVSVASPVSGWMSSFVRTEGDQLTWECSPTARQHYRSIITRQPDFPFPYLLLATCLKRANDEHWRSLAERGLEIVVRTTKVPDHDPEHDEALQRFQALLHETAPPPS